MKHDETYILVENIIDSKDCSDTWHGEKWLNALYFK